MRTTVARTPRFSTFELILLALFSSLVVVSKIVLHFPIGIPGHSSVFWMAIVVVALGIVPKLGAGSIVGLISAVLAAFLGLGDRGPVYTFVSYLVLGIFSDLAAAFMGGVEAWLPAALVGAVGSVSKMIAKAIMGSLVGVPAGFLAFGLFLSFASNVLSGAIGGLLGYLVLRALRKAGFFSYLAEKR